MQRQFCAMFRRNVELWSDTQGWKAWKAWKGTGQRTGKGKEDDGNGNVKEDDENAEGAPINVLDERDGHRKRGKEITTTNMTQRCRLCGGGGRA